MDLLLGPVYNCDGDGIILRHTLTRALTSLAGLCEEGSSEKRWTYDRVVDISDILSLSDKKRDELRQSLTKVFRCEDGVKAVRELLYGKEAASQGGTRGDPDSGVILSWADEMDLVESVEEKEKEIAELRGQLDDMSEQVKRKDTDRMDAITQCGDEFVRQISEVRRGLADMVKA